MKKLNHLVKTNRLAIAALVAASALFVTSTSASAQFVGTAGVQFLGGGPAYTGTGVLGESFTSYAATTPNADGINQAATEIGTTGLYLAINDPLEDGTNPSNNYYSQTGDEGADGLFDNFISHTFNAPSPLNFTLSGLQAGETYAVAVYAGPNGNLGNQTPVNVTLNGTSIGQANPQGSGSPGDSFQLGVNYVTADAVANASGDIVIGNSSPTGDTYSLTNGIGISAVPEPGTWALMLAGVGAIVSLQVLRRRNS